MHPQNHKNEINLEKKVKINKAANEEKRKHNTRVRFSMTTEMDECMSI